MKTLAVAALVAAIGLTIPGFSPNAFAQETTAGIQGTVRDASGGAVAGATVELTSPALIGGARKQSTDGDGNYRFAALAPGDYTMMVTAKGFRTFRQVGIDLTVGRLPNLEIKLEVGAVTETIEVASSAAMVDTTQSKVAVTVQREVLDNLPKGRSFQTLIPFAPGARGEPLQSGVSSGANSGYQIDGAGDSENVYLIDGVNITNIQNGGVGKQFQMDFIEEVQIKSSSFEAEHGGALGGVINVVPKRGSNEWHGALLTYYQSNKLNANNSDRTLRTNPATSLSTAARLDATPEYYMAAKDQRSIIEPGYQLGGPLWRDKLWLFSSYVPSVDTTRRITNFTGANPGPRTLTSTQTNHNAYNRLDYGPTNSLRLYGSWNYGYFRQTGTLGGADSPAGQVNTGRTTDPNALRSDAGSVNPLSIFTFGGDWTPTSKLVVSARYGYFFNNTEQRGIPTGNRYLYSTSLSATTKDIQGNPFPTTAPFNLSGFFNIPANLATSYDAYKRKGLNIDASYLVHFAGTHNFKGGYFRQIQSEDVLRSYQGSITNIYYGQAYTPLTAATACDGIIAQNKSQYGSSECQGKYGYFFVGGTTTSNTGTDHQTAQAVYFQDQWQVGRYLTLNLGVRFDEETQPPYDPVRFPTVHFGWGDKIAPRLGGAYDLLHNGKVKVYASYGQFYDIMKMGLARGSFGSDYWHECVYAMDDPDYTKITPTGALGGCPASGPAAGVTVGRFIENWDARATKADPADPAISPSMKPMKQHEFVTGLDWAITNNWALETRYARKRLDNTIEDMAITDSLGFYIGNPGTPFADILHRSTSIPDPNSKNPPPFNTYLNTTPFCAECPPVVGAHRRYDGAEFRLVKRPSNKWFGSVSYTYSKLQGNYAGLTNSDPTDGTFGRHAPNNGRAFDIPTMTYTPSGKADDGPLSTDRPHTATLFGSYRLKWKHMETNFGATQTAFQGTPISTCLPVVGTSSACQWAEGRGNFVKLIRNADGSISKGDVVTGARTDPLIQTDFNIRHEIVIKEGQRLSFEANFINIFNQRATEAVYEFAIPTSDIQPSRPSRFVGDPNLDWNKVMSGYNYIDALNGTGAFGNGVQPKLTLASRYGMPTLFQAARNIRLAIRFTF